MTYPAPQFLSDDIWFGPAPLSDKAKELKFVAESKQSQIVPAVHEYFYQLATKTKLTCYRDQPWISGAGK